MSALLGASLRARRLIGAAFLVGLVGAAAAVLAGSGRTFGRGIRIEVEIASTGPLKADAKLRIAGRDVGEVRGMRRVATSEAAPEGERHVIVDCFLAREFVPSVRKNSMVFIATPSVLGEAYLEIGPAAPRGAEPGPAVSDGDRLRGIDPAEIDRMMARGFASLTTIVALLREHRPTIDELLRNGDALLAELAGLPSDAGQLGRIRDHAARAADDGLAIVHALGDARAVPRVRALAHDLGATAERAAPDLAQLAFRVARAADRVAALSDLFSPARRASLARALAALGRVVDGGALIVRDVKELVARVERGQGSVGAFLADKELFDDLHETGRIIVSQPWTTILKPGKGEKTLAH